MGLAELGLELAELGVMVVGAGLQVGAQAFSLPLLVALASLFVLYPDISPS